MQIHGEHRVDQVAENHARRAALLEGGQNRNEAPSGAAAALSAAAAEAVAAAVQAVVQAVEAAVEAKEGVVLATGPVGRSAGATVPDSTPEAAEEAGSEEDGWEVISGKPMT